MVLARANPSISHRAVAAQPSAVDELLLLKQYRRPVGSFDGVSGRVVWMFGESKRLRWRELAEEESEPSGRVIGKS